MKPALSAEALAAQLLAEQIARYERDPALRLSSGISLTKLADVRKIRRQLLKQKK